MLSTIPIGLSQRNSSVVEWETLFSTEDRLSDQIIDVDTLCRLPRQHHEMPPKQIPAITALTVTTTNSESTRQWQ